MMNGRRKSDRPVVATKPANKVGATVSNTEASTAERVERRGLAKGKPPQQNTNRTQDRAAVQFALGRIRQAAVKDKKVKFTSLMHHIYDLSMLREAYYALQRDAAPRPVDSYAKIFPAPEIGRTPGAGTFPANSHDLTGEYSRSALDIRHRFVFGGSFEAPLGISLSPFIAYRSALPFNITTGADANEDTLFNERPAFGTDPSEPGIIVTHFGLFDPTPDPGNLIIPRNYGRGSGFFITNLRVAKEFGFGGGEKSNPIQGQGGGGGGRGGITSPLGGSAPSPQSDDDDEESRYKIELAVQIRNLFNHTNGSLPVGNLRSLSFGQSLASASGFGFGGGGTQSAGNRRLEFQLQFSF